MTSVTTCDQCGKQCTTISRQIWLAWGPHIDLCGPHYVKYHDALKKWQKRYFKHTPVSLLQ